MAIMNSVQMEIQERKQRQLDLNRLMLNTLLAPGFPGELKAVFAMDINRRSEVVQSLQNEFHLARTRKLDRVYRGVILSYDLRNIA